MRYRLLRTFSSFFDPICRATVRAVLASVLFTTSVVMLLRYLGVPMPSAHELLRQVEGLSKLSKIFS